jgi:uroporphyrinogen decarboxylase
VGKEIMQFREDGMTSEERIEALLHGDRIDRVPFCSFTLGFNCINVGYSIADYFNNPKKSCESFEWTSDQYNFDKLPILGYASNGAWEFGGEIMWPDGEFSQAPHITRHPVTSEEDAMALRVPDVETAGSVPIFLEWAIRYEETGHRYILSFEEPFLSATNLTGIDTFCRWIYKKPALAHRLLGLSTDFKIEFFRILKEKVGTKRCIPMLGDAAAENRIISPAMFEEFALPYSKKLHEHVLELGFRHICAHICGEQNRNYPHWAKIPMGEPGIISVSQEVDLKTAMQYFPDHIIMGNIEPPLIQSSSAEDVYKQAKTCIEKGRMARRGFIFAPGCELPPKAPPYNVWILMKAVDDFGWYE